MEDGRRSKRARVMSTEDDKVRWAAKDDQREELECVRMSEDQGGLETNLQDILANQLVCKNIASYLSLADMKAASEVNRPFLQAIRETKRFKQTAVLVISKKNPQVKSMIRKTEFEWRGVKVDGTDPSEILEDLPRLLKSIEFVCLEARPWKIEAGKLVEKNPTAASLLTAVLSSTPNLSHLKMDFRLFIANLQAVLSSPAVQETLRKLDHLDLVTLAVCFEELIYANDADKEEFARNARIFMELPNRLKSLKLADLNLMTPNEENNCVDSCVLRLLRNNRATLEQLSLDGDFLNIQELQELVLPALKTLTTEVNDDDESTTLVEFLKNQKSLEELTLECILLEERLVASIRGRSGKLKKLDLTAGEFPETFDWSFLAGMTCLKKFRFEFWNRRGPEGVGSRLLTLLPKNQLTSLSLESPADGFNKFWRADGVEAALEFKAELLRGFQCLRRLRLVGWEDFVDDQVMQRLLKEFSLLEEFQLSDCSMLTDAGISGNTTAEWGRNASFVDLRRLTTLKIVRCPGVTPNGVLASCVNVRSLRSLEYTNPPGPIVESVVLGLVELNPRMERLTLGYAGDVADLGKLKAQVKKKNPRMELSLTEEKDDG